MLDLRKITSFFTKRFRKSLANQASSSHKGLKKAEEIPFFLLLAMTTIAAEQEPLQIEPVTDLRSALRAGFKQARRIEIVFDGEPHIVDETHTGNVYATAHFYAPEQKRNQKFLSISWAFLPSGTKSDPAISVA